MYINGQKFSITLPTYSPVLTLTTCTWTNSSVMRIDAVSDGKQLWQSWLPNCSLQRTNCCCHSPIHQLKLMNRKYGNMHFASFQYCGWYLSALDMLFLRSMYARWVEEWWIEIKKIPILIFITEIHRLLDGNIGERKNDNWRKSTVNYQEVN